MITNLDFLPPPIVLLILITFHLNQASLHFTLARLV